MDIGLKLKELRILKGLTQEELAEQLPVAKELLAAMGFHVLELAGYEADDILGTVSAMCEREGIPCCLMTGDRDSLQLISDTTHILLATNTDTVDTDRAAFREKYGVEPEQFVDVFFEYVRKNGENYRLLCRSNDFLLSVKKLASFAAARFLELCYASHRLQNKQHIELEIRIFVEGLLCEYVRYCRGSVTPTSEELYTYTREWVRDFAARRFVIE